MKSEQISQTRLKMLKTLPYDKMSVADINFLTRIWVINWIGPESYWKYVRRLMTYLFSMVSYKRHDIAFWQKSGFHKANKWLLKYSFISLADDYENVTKMKLFKKLYHVPKFYITIPFKAWIISLAYTAVESPAWRKAYNASKTLD